MIETRQPTPPAPDTHEFQIERARNLGAKASNLALDALDPDSHAFYADRMVRDAMALAWLADRATKRALGVI